MVIAEIGINHNGGIGIAKKLIEGAKLAGADAVKFQKRDIDTVYTKEFLDSERDSPYGATQRSQKNGIELTEDDYKEIDRYCKEIGIEWFCAAWDINSLWFLEQFDLKYNKVASAMITNLVFLDAVAKQKKYTFISTGMCTLDDISNAVEIFRKHECPFELLHCTSTYPMNNDEANLNMIPKLKSVFDCKVGYSGHELGIAISCAAYAMGASSIERHITLDRSMYGSDQSASIEIAQFKKMIDSINAISEAFGTDVKEFSDREKVVAGKLRYWS